MRKLREQIRYNTENIATVRSDRDLVIEELFTAYELGKMFSLHWFRYFHIGPILVV